MSFNYAHVRTNWVRVSMETIQDSPGVLGSGPSNGGLPAGYRHAECVFLSASQISSGTMSIPAKRAQLMFSLPGSPDRVDARVFVATDSLDASSDANMDKNVGNGIGTGIGIGIGTGTGIGTSIPEVGRGDVGNDTEDALGEPELASWTLIPIREPFSPAKVAGQRAMPPSSMAPVTHSVPDDNKVVVWNTDGTRGYLAKLRTYASQPTQVFLCGLHAIFDGFKVHARCVMCFCSTGVLGHAQVVVGYAGGEDGLFARVAEGVVHGFHSVVGRKVGVGGCMEGLGGTGVVRGVRVAMAPLRVTTLRTVIDQVEREVAVVDKMYGCFLRKKGEMEDVIVVDSCGVPKKAYLSRRENGGVSPAKREKRGDGSAWSKDGQDGEDRQDRQDRQDGEEVKGEQEGDENRKVRIGPRGPKTAKHARLKEFCNENSGLGVGIGSQSSLSSLLSARRVFGDVNEQRVVQSVGVGNSGDVDVKDRGCRRQGGKVKVSRRKATPTRAIQI